MQEFWSNAPIGGLENITSELTLLETLVQPLKQADSELIEAYETILNASAITLFPITKDILRSAAEFRAKQNFKTPDAIHCATALITGCDYFVTNDAGFKRLQGTEVVVLQDHI